MSVELPRLSGDERQLSDIPLWQENTLTGVTAPDADTRSATAAATPAPFPFAEYRPGETAATVSDPVRTVAPLRVTLTDAAPRATPLGIRKLAWPGDT